MNNCGHSYNKGSVISKILGQLPIQRDHVGGLISAFFGSPRFSHSYSISRPLLSNITCPSLVDFI